LAVPFTDTDNRVAAVAPDVTDRPLDEFVNEAGDDGSGAAAEPSVPTMRWSDERAPCADCGERVSRRWRAGERFVCADCKDW
jgi:hypothetical protein